MIITVIDTEVKIYLIQEQTYIYIYIYSTECNWIDVIAYRFCFKDSTYNLLVFPMWTLVLGKRTIFITNYQKHTAEYCFKISITSEVKHLINVAAVMNIVAPSVLELQFDSCTWTLQLFSKHSAQDEYQCHSGTFVGMTWLQPKIESSSDDDIPGTVMQILQTVQPWSHTYLWLWGLL